MPILGKNQDKTPEYICLENFMNILDLSLQDTGDDAFKLLPELLDKGLKLSFSEAGYLLDDQVAHKGDVKVALIRLKLKLSNTDEPKSELYKKAIIKTQSGYEIPLGKLLVKQSDVRKIYADYGEKEYPWAQTEKEWGLFPTSGETTKISFDAPAQSEEGIAGANPSDISKLPPEKFKTRNPIQRENTALILLHDALDEMEAKDGKTPTASELTAFLLSGNFKHPLIQKYPAEGTSDPIEDNTRNGILRTLSYFGYSNPLDAVSLAR